MRSTRLPAIFMLLASTSATTTWAEPGFDEKYQRDFNIFNPINQFNPNNPFNPINRYRPENPLNPINKYNPNTPFAPLDGGGGWKR